MTSYTEARAKAQTKANATELSGSGAHRLDILVPERDRYAEMTQEDFGRILGEITCNEDLMTIPGVYEIVAEHYNNDVLARWEDEQPDPEDEEE